MNARLIHGVLTAAILAAAAALAGCAAFTPPAHCVDRGDGLCWFPAPLQIPVTKYDWEIDTTANANARCGYGMPWHNATCVMGRLRETGTCHIVSALTEDQAMTRISLSPLSRFPGRSQSIWCHEIESHCGLNVCGGNPTGTQWLHADGGVLDLLGRK